MTHSPPPGALDALAPESTPEAPLTGGAVSVHAFGSDLPDPAAPLREALTIDGACLLDPDAAADPEVLAALSASFSRVRADAIEAFSGAAFQGTMRALSTELARRHFGPSVPALFQRTPSIRLHLPDALGTSWHVDNWYGHGPGSTTFWVPLTEVAPGAGVRFATDPALLDRLERGLGRTIELADVNRLCEAGAEEVRCAPGHYLAFDARTLHGSVGNASGRLRVSIDFRGVPERIGTGGKPLANYRRVGPTIAAARGADARAVPIADATASAPAHGRRALKYISGANGTSAKYQHVLLEAYAHDNALSIVRNEAEIESLSSRPVLAAYAARRVPEPDSYDDVLLGSIDLLPADEPTARALLRRAAAAGVRLHFVAEDCTFSGALDEDATLERLAARHGPFAVSRSVRAA